MSYVLRNAIEEDIPYITDVCGRDMLRLLGREKWFHTDAMDNTLLVLITAGHVMVVEEDGTIVGALGSVPTACMWNPSILLLAEMFWWVREDKRNTRIGHMLLNAFEKRGRDIGAHELVMSTMPSTEVSLAKRGYVTTEYSMTKEI